VSDEGAMAQEHPIPGKKHGWLTALGFVVLTFLSSTLTLALLAWPDAASSNDQAKIMALEIAVACIFGWWGVFRLGRSLTRGKP
jgi:hypothetical protein